MRTTRCVSASYVDALVMAAYRESAAGTSRSSIIFDFACEAMRDFLAQSRTRLRNSFPAPYEIVARVRDVKRPAAPALVAGDGSDAAHAIEDHAPEGKPAAAKVDGARRKRSRSRRKRYADISDLLGLGGEENQDSGPDRRLSREAGPPALKRRASGSYDDATGANRANVGDRVESNSLLAGTQERLLPPADEHAADGAEEAVKKLSKEMEGLFLNIAAKQPEPDSMSPADSPLQAGASSGSSSGESNLDAGSCNNTNTGASHCSPSCPSFASSSSSSSGVVSASSSSSSSAGSPTDVLPGLGDVTIPQPGRDHANQQVSSPAGHDDAAVGGGLTLSDPFPPRKNAATRSGPSAASAFPFKAFANPAIAGVAAVADQKGTDPKCKGSVEVDAEQDVAMLEPEGGVERGMLPEQHDVDSPDNEIGVGEKGKSQPVEDRQEWSKDTPDRILQTASLAIPLLGIAPASSSKAAAACQEWLREECELLNGICFGQGPDPTAVTILKDVDLALGEAASKLDAEKQANGVEKAAGDAGGKALLKDGADVVCERKGSGAGEEVAPSQVDGPSPTARLFLGAYDDFAFRSEAVLFNPWVCLCASVPEYMPLARCGCCGYVSAQQKALAVRRGETGSAWADAAFRTALVGGRRYRLCYVCFEIHEIAGAEADESPESRPNPVWHNDSRPKDRRPLLTEQDWVKARKKASRVYGRFRKAARGREFAGQPIGRNEVRAIRAWENDDDRVEGVALQSREMQKKAGVKERMIMEKLKGTPGVATLASFDDGLPTIRIDYAGATLSEVFGKMDAAARSTTFEQILAAAENIWEHQIVHLDWKLDNICVKTECGSVTVIDFGSAQMLDHAWFERGGCVVRDLEHTWPFLNLSFEQFHEAEIKKYNFATKTGEDGAPPPAAYLKFVQPAQAGAMATQLIQQEAFLVWVLEKLLTDKCTADTVLRELQQEDGRYSIAGESETRTRLQALRNFHADLGKQDCVKYQKKLRERIPTPPGLFERQITWDAK